MIFQYAQLPKGSIRLVRFHPNSTPASIHLTLEHQERYVDKNVHYTALAYETKERNSDMKDITLQGRTKMIPQPLWQALSALVAHHDTSRRFWIEYVCVNQGDDAEKLAHKTSLSRIYASADEVLLWVDSGDTIAEAEREKASSPNSLLPEAESALKSLKESNGFRSTLERLQLQHARKVTLFSGPSLIEARTADVNSTL